MTLSFKDPNGDEWGLLAWSRSDDRRHPATAADLLAALGQLSTGSDGPSDEELWRIDQAALAAVPDDASVHETNTAALRVLFAAGRASRQPEVDEANRTCGDHSLALDRKHRECIALQDKNRFLQEDLACVEALRADAIDGRDKLQAEVDRLTAELERVKLERARVIRSWRVDLGCTWGRIAALAERTWGGSLTSVDGARLCEEAAVTLGEDPGGEPWN